MTSDIESGILAMADTLVEASEWSHRLYSNNAWCVEDEQIDKLVLLALSDGNERYRVNAAPAPTSLIVHANGRVVPVAPTSAGRP